MAAVRAVGQTGWGMSRAVGQLSVARGQPIGQCSSDAPSPTDGSEKAESESRVAAQRPRDPISGARSLSLLGMVCREESKTVDVASVQDRSIAPAAAEPVHEPPKTPHVATHFRPGSFAGSFAGV